MYNDNNQPTTIKQAAINFDIFIRDGGIGTSMFFVLILLIIVNAHSLHFLFGDGVMSWIFSIIGSLGFSIATTAVIRKPVAKWMKYLFPLFDTVLVFLGFNTFHEDIPVRMVMIILFALFLGSIILSLGIINLKMHKKEEKQTKYKRKIKELTSKVELLEKENIIIESERSEFEKLKIENKENLSELEVSKNLLAENEPKLANHMTYKKGYLMYHASRIRKKNPENYTDNEKEIMQIVKGIEEQEG